MKSYSPSKQLIKNTKHFLNIRHYTFVDKLLGKSGVFYGWGRKRSGERAIELAKKHDTSFVLLEDGFIRSIGLGVDGSPSFSIVEDDLGIYYDATRPSRLEGLLNSYDFAGDVALMEDARRAIGLILEYHISKYNSAPEVDEGFRMKYGLTGEIPDDQRKCPRVRVRDDERARSVDARFRGNDGKVSSFRAPTRNLDPRVPKGNALGCKPEDDGEVKSEDDESRLQMAGEIPDRVRDDVGMVRDDVDRVLIIAQTAGDASLEYGMLDEYTTEDMINAAIEENPDAKVYLKVHPDVLSGKKKSDIDIASAKERCIIIEENVNPISLLKHFDKVYTKTSGMGFEAILCGCECVCFGMPFYAGWGITDDRSVMRDEILNQVQDDNVRHSGLDPESNLFQRRTRKLTVEEVFAAAYILYTRYYNPYTKQESDIIDTIEEIVKMKSVV